MQADPLGMTGSDCRRGNGTPTFLAGVGVPDYCHGAACGSAELEELEAEFCTPGEARRPRVSHDSTNLNVRLQSALARTATLQLAPDPSWSRHNHGAAGARAMKGGCWGDNARILCPDGAIALCGLDLAVGESSSHD